MASIGIGIIGLGRHGLRYAKHLLEDVTDARLTAVCRRDAVQGQAFASRHGIRYYADYRELIADRAVQALIVVTPPSHAKAICLEGVKAGKPLLMEKPLATNGTDAAEMVEAAESAGVPLMTAHTLRFDEAVLALKSQLVQVGAPRYLALTNRTEPRPDLLQDPTDYAGRGVLLGTGIHLLDMIRFVTDDEVVEVSCEMERWTSSGLVRGIPDVRALASLRTGRNLPCIVDVSRLTGGRVSRAEWVGEAGQISAEWVHHRVACVMSRNELQEWTVQDSPTVLATLRAFLGALKERTPMPITGRDGQKAVEIADACYESAATGKPVRL
jgi:predicted dehydrogenase